MNGGFLSSIGQFILPYDAVRQSDDPDKLLLGFLQETYAAAAELATWDRKALERELRAAGQGRARRGRLLPRDGRSFRLPVVENPSRPNDQCPEPEAEQYRKQRPISFRVQLSARVRLILTRECPRCVHEQNPPFGFGRVA